MIGPCKVFVVFPSVYPTRAAKSVEKWRAMGYQTGVYLNSTTQGDSGAHKEWRGPYNGYWDACNFMARILTQGEESTGIVVYASDDIDPDPTHTADELSAQFVGHFPNYFGVMQPCGDKQGIDATGKPAAARICGSPWLGREWVRRAFGGMGAVDSRFRQFYGDELLYEVSKKLGVLWMRPDLTQYHYHWSFGHERQQPYQRKNSEAHWQKDKDLFMAEKAAGFPNSEPLPE